VVIQGSEAIRVLIETKELVPVDLSWLLSFGEKFDFRARCRFETRIFGYVLRK
jgi:hypothetical protein